MGASCGRNWRKGVLDILLSYALEKPRDTDRVARYLND